MRTRPPAEVFVARLRELVPEGGGKDFAAAAGISEQTLSRWRAGNGNVNPQLGTIVKLARALKVSTVSLLADEAPRPAEPAPEEWEPFSWLHVCGEVGAGPGHRWEHEPGEECGDADVGERIPVLRRELVRCNEYGRARLLRVTERRGAGRSMLPAIAPGAVLLAAVGERVPFFPGRSYIVRDPLDGGLMVKEVYPYTDGVLLVSKNPDFPRVKVTFDPDTDPFDRPRPVVGIVMRILDQAAARPDEEVTP